MADYDNTNRGALWKNDRKESDRHPDYTGNLNVDGAEFRLSAWIKEGKKGKFMSLSITPKDVSKGAGYQPRRNSAPDDDYDDSDAPF